MLMEQRRLQFSRKFIRACLKTQMQWRSGRKAQRLSHIMSACRKICTSRLWQDTVSGCARSFQTRPYSIHSGVHSSPRAADLKSRARHLLREIQLLQDSLILVEVNRHGLTVQLEREALLPLVNQDVLRALALRSFKFNVNGKAKDCGRHRFRQLRLRDVERERMRRGIIKGAHAKLRVACFINPLVEKRIQLLARCLFKSVFKIACLNYLVLVLIQIFVERVPEHFIAHLFAQHVKYERALLVERRVE